MSRIFLATVLLSQLVLLVPSSDAFEFPFLFPWRREDDQAAPEPPAQEHNGVIHVDKLSEGFYQRSCPNAEQIVAQSLAKIVKINPNAISNLIRLQFHDCFVLGCDASVLLDYSPLGDEVEKSSSFNGILLKGADVIDDIKTELEKQCPETVSCADTLAFATNEAMVLAGMPRRAPLGGRRDSLMSLAALASDDNLPDTNWSMDKVIQLFNRKGFSTEEMVILLGAHSVGSTHCNTFMDRVYNFQNTGKPDPTLTVEVVEELRNQCPGAGTAQFRNPPVNFDETPLLLDNLFYKNLVQKNKSLLLTDAHLMTDARTANFVKQLANDPALFQKKFAEAMVKLGALGVVTGNKGEVRRTCRSTNN